MASHIQISGNHSVRVFRIDPGKTVVLKNLDIINGKVVLFYSGGAINNNGGALTVSGSSFSGNSARNGGGIHIHNGGTLTVSNSTFSANSAVDFGGGIFNDTGCTLTVSNSTFSANSAGFGGGIENGGTLTVNNSIFSGNLADNGGGIGNNGILIVRNTILADNSGGDSRNTGTVSSAVNNLIKDSSNACGLTHGANGNIIGSDPLLSPLANNGGLTQTMALQAGSPAINAGNPATCTTTDQRGYARVGICDIGSYEYSVSPVTAGVTLNSVSSNPPYTATATATGTGITERGFFWWIPPTPATHFGGSESGLLPAGGTGAGSFSLNLTGLKPGNTYHIKAYIKFSGQLITSDEMIITAASGSGKSAPTVITKSCTLNADGTLSAAGEITDIGSSAVNVYGFVYAKHPAPYTGDNMAATGDRALALWDKAPVYQGLKFTGTVKNIPPGKWYLRAYAHNENPDSDAAQTASLGYGEDISFTIACTPETCIPGDVNGDGRVELADAMLVLRILAGMPVGNINPNADVNGDDKIGLAEFGYILQKTAELR